MRQRVMTVSSDCGVPGVQGWWVTLLFELHHHVLSHLLVHQLAQLTLPRRSRCLAFHPNGNILAVGLEAPTESGDAPMAFHPPGKKSNLPISIGDDNVEAKGGGFLLV